MVILYSNKDNPLDTFWKELGDYEKVKNTRSYRTNKKKNNDRGRKVKDKLDEQEQEKK